MQVLMSKSLAELADDLRTGRLSAVSLVEAATANHHQSNGSCGAYISWDPALALQQARAADAMQTAGNPTSLLHGIPVSVKDLYGIRGYPTFAGTPKRLPDEWETEGPIVECLRSQQAVLMGKTHTVEFAFGGLGLNPHWEMPRNPWATTQPRVPGGSSSGAGVSLCAGSALLALGTDTAGSVRIPASMTGNVGLKTSKGRWSTDGIVPLSPSLDTVGLLTRTVEDAAYVFYALDPDENSTPVAPRAIDVDLAGLRLGICDGLLWDDCSPGIAETVTAAIEELVNCGVNVKSFDIPEFDQVYPVFKQGGLAAPELHAFLKNELPDWMPLLDKKIAQRMEDAAGLPPQEYLARVELFKRLSTQTTEKLRAIDILISPTVPVTPPIFEEVNDLQRYRQANLLSLRNTCMANYLGLCAISMPVGLDQAGMPVGMQLMAGLDQDRSLLAIALAFERALGTMRERIGLPAGLVGA